MAGSWGATDVRLSHSGGSTHAGSTHPPGSHRPPAWAYDPVAHGHAHYGHGAAGGAGHGVPVTETSAHPVGFAPSGAYAPHHAPYGHGAGGTDPGRSYATGGGYGPTDYPYPATSGIATSMSSHLAHPHGGNASGGEYHPQSHLVVMPNGVWIPGEALMPTSGHAIRHPPHPQPHHHLPRHAARTHASQDPRSHPHGGVGMGRERSSGGNGSGGNGGGGRRRRGQAQPQAQDQAPAPGPVIAGWQEGVCVTRHGSSGGAAVKSKACRYWLHGVNNHFGRTCSFVHPCRHVVIAGKCSHGRRCTDDHVCRPHLWTDECPMGGLEGGCPYIHLIMPEERDAVRAQYKGWCDDQGRPTEDALLSLGITDPAEAPAANVSTPRSRTHSAVSTGGSSGVQHPYPHNSSDLPPSTSMMMMMKMPPQASSLGYHPAPHSTPASGAFSAPGSAPHHSQYAVSSGSVTPVPAPSSPTMVPDSGAGSSPLASPGRSQPLHTGLGHRSYGQLLAGHDVVAYTNAMPSMPHPTHPAIVSSLPLSTGRSASEDGFAVSDKPHDRRLHQQHLPVQHVSDPRFASRLAPHDTAAVPRPSSQTGAADHGSVWVHAQAAGAEGAPSRANRAARASSLGVDSIHTLTIRSGVAQAPSQASPRLDTADSEATDRASVDVSAIATDAQASTPHAGGSHQTTPHTHHHAHAHHHHHTDAPVPSSSAASSHDPSTGDVTVARVSPRSSTNDLLASHRETVHASSHQLQDASKPPSPPASVHGSQCSGATSSVRTPFGGGMRHTTSGVSLSSSAGGEEERPLDAEACAALCTATAIPVGPTARPLCPFWFADSLAGCRAGPDCPFFHHGQIQLTGRALPRRKDIEAAREAWCRRVLDRGPQTGITTNPGQGIHRPGDTVTPVAMALAVKQAISLYESIGGDQAAVARAAALAERGDAGSETASNGVSSRGGGGGGGGGDAGGAASNGNGSTRRSRRRRSNNSSSRAAGSRGAGATGEVGSPLRGQSGHRSGSGAPPSPMLQGMGFGGPVHSASSSGLMPAPGGTDGSHGMLRSPHTMGMGRVLSGEELAAMGLPLSAYTTPGAAALSAAQGAGADAGSYSGRMSDPSSPYHGAVPTSLSGAVYHMPDQQGVYMPHGTAGHDGSLPPHSTHFGHAGGVALPGTSLTHGYPDGAVMATSTSTGRGGLVSRQSHGELYASASMHPTGIPGTGASDISHETHYSQQHLVSQQHQLHHHSPSSPLARVAGTRLPRSGSSGAVMMTTSERPQHQQQYHSASVVSSSQTQHATGLVLTASQASTASAQAISAAAQTHSTPWTWHQPESDQHLSVAPSASYGISTNQPPVSQPVSTAMSAGMLTRGHGSATALPVVMDTEMEMHGSMGHAHASASWAAHSIDAPASRFLHQSGVASTGQSVSSLQQAEHTGATSLLDDEGVASRLGLTSVGSSLGLTTPSVHSGPHGLHTSEPSHLASLGIPSQADFGVVASHGDDLLGSPDTPGGLLDPTNGLSDPLADMDATSVPASAGLAGGNGLGMLPFDDEIVSHAPNTQLGAGQHRASVDADDTGLVPFGLLD